MQAYLYPPNESNSTGVWSFQLVKSARREAAAILARVRSRAARYLMNVRRRAYRSGYSAGLLSASQEIFTVIDSLKRNAAQQNLDSLNQISEAAGALAQAIIKRELVTSPLAYQAWLQEAAQYLQSEETITLHHSPTLHDLMDKVAAQSELPIRLVPDPHLSGSEVYLATPGTHSAHGRLGYGWQEALDLLITTESK